MDYSGFKTPLISGGKIKEAAAKCRLKYWNDRIPVDIERVLESRLRMIIIPLPGLRNQFGFDSFITSDWKSIYVDNDYYQDDLGYKRVRFSLAHEFGHFILHKETFEGLKIKTLEDYYDFYDKVPGEQYSFLETQANKFAGYFLVPRDSLDIRKRELLAEKRILLQGSKIEIDDDLLLDYIIDDLAGFFDVSSGAMGICLRS